MLLISAACKRHRKLVIIVIIITIIIISLCSSRYSSSGSDASYTWDENVKCQEATCTECKIQKRWCWGGEGGGSRIHSGTLSISPSLPLLIVTLSSSFRLNFLHLPWKCFSDLSSSDQLPFLPNGNETHLSSAWFFPANIPTSGSVYTFIHTLLRSQYAETNIVDRLATGCAYHFPPPSGCGIHVLSFPRQKNGTLHPPRTAFVPSHPQYAKSEPPRRVLSTFSRSWHLLLSPLGKYGASKKQFSSYLSCYYGPLLLPRPTACCSAQRLSQCINPSDSSHEWMLP